MDSVWNKLDGWMDGWIVVNATASQLYRKSVAKGITQFHVPPGRGKCPAFTQPKGWKAELVWAPCVRWAFPRLIVTMHGVVVSGIEPLYLSVARPTPQPRHHHAMHVIHVHVMQLIDVWYCYFSWLCMTVSDPKLQTVIQWKNDLT